MIGLVIATGALQVALLMWLWFELRKMSRASERQREAIAKFRRQVEQSKRETELLLDRIKAWREGRHEL